MLPHPDWRLVAAVSAALFAGAAMGGQVVLDGSLGRSGPLHGPNFSVPPSKGKISGSNLFQSFSQFNLDAGETVDFSGPASISNVIARVTGGASRIDGTIHSSIADANFFLINSSGVVFGPEAKLDVGGSFSVTTARYLRQSDGGRFDSTPSTRDAALSTAAPSAFGFLASASPATISVSGTAGRSAALRVPNGNALRLAGGQVAISHATLTASGGSVQLSAADASEVPLNLAASSASATPTASIAITSSTINSSYSSENPSINAGSVSIRGGSVELNDSSILSRSVAGGSGGVDVAAGSEISIVGSTLDASTSGHGTAGPVNVDAPHLVLDNATVTSQSAGTVLIEDPKSPGSTAGTVTITADQADTTGNNLISAAELKLGTAGTVTLNIKSATKDGAVATFDVDSASRAWFYADQLTSDDTLPIDNGGTITGTPNTFGTPSAPGTDYLVTGGTQRGANVFFSFKHFDISTADSVSFDVAPGAVTPQFFLVRVTSGVSNINGVVASNVPHAKVIVMNPHGMVYGADAFLGFDGVTPFGYVATTGDYVGLGAATRFDANPSSNDSSLSSATPSQYGFSSSHAAGVSILQGKNSATPFGITAQPYQFNDPLSIVAGNISVTGFNPTLNAGTVFGTRINLVSVGSPGVVTLGAEFTSPPAEMSGFTSMGPIDVYNGGVVAGFGRQTADTAVYVNAGHLNLNSGGEIIGGTSQHDLKLAGGMAVHAAMVNIDGRGIDENFPTGLTANYLIGSVPPRISVHAGTINIIGNGRISTRSFSTAPAGFISVTADHQILMDGTDDGDHFFTGITADAAKGSGAGEIDLRADSVIMRRNSRIRSASAGQARGGDVNITTVGDFIADARPFAGGGGQQEDPVVTTSATSSTGGNINIRSTDGKILVEGTSLFFTDPTKRFSTIDAKAKQNANITLHAKDGITIDHSPISAQALAGKGGNIRLLATEGPVILYDSIIDGRSPTVAGPVRVNIQAPNFFESTDSRILSDAITAPVDLDIAGSIINLAGAVSQPELKLQDACRQLTLQASYSSFTIEGANGVPLDPETLSPGFYASQPFDISSGTTRPGASR